VRPLRPFVFVALALLALAGSAFALDIPPTPRQWFTDTAGVVTPDQAAQLNEKLRNFEQQSGAQFIIYIFPSLDGEAMEDFTIRAAEKWKVGNKKYDNGLILFLFIKERRMRFEVAYGLEPTVTDAYTTQVRNEILAPHFKSNDYYGGLNAAVDAVRARVLKQEPAVPPVSGSGARPALPQGRGGANVSPFFILMILFVFFFFLLPMLRRGGRRRGGGCIGCLPLFFPFGGGGFGGGGITFGGGGGGWGGGGGGFSAGGGSFGGGGSSGGW
jgi:uncharacterized protein